MNIGNNIIGNIKFKKQIEIKFDGKIKTHVQTLEHVWEFI